MYACVHAHACMHVGSMCAACVWKLMSSDLNCSPLLKTMTVCLYTRYEEKLCCAADTEVRGQLWEVVSLLPLSHRFWGLNSGHQASAARGDMDSAILTAAPLIFWGSLSLSLELIGLDRLRSHQDLPVYSCGAVVTDWHTAVPNFWLVARNLNSGTHACMEDSFLAEPFPEPFTNIDWHCCSLTSQTRWLQV